MDWQKLHDAGKERSDDQCCGKNKKNLLMNNRLLSFIWDLDKSDRIYTKIPSRCCMLISSHILCEHISNIVMHCSVSWNVAIDI